MTSANDTMIDYTLKNCDPDNRNNEINSEFSK